MKVHSVEFRIFSPFITFDKTVKGAVIKEALLRYLTDIVGDPFARQALEWAFFVDDMTIDGEEQKAIQRKRENGKYTVQTRNGWTRWRGTLCVTHVPDAYLVDRLVYHIKDLGRSCHWFGLTNFEVVEWAAKVEERT